MDPAVVVDSLRVKRGSNPVLDGINLKFEKGVITGLLGPSGSGKTTLMRTIVGVQIIDAGSVTVLGAPAGSPEARREVGYVTQAPSIYPDLTVKENVRYFGSLYDVPSAAVSETISSVGLSEQAGQLVRTLSGGQLSRASLACALVAKPQLLVLDEPTVGQDPVLREELWAQFHELAHQGVTLIVSSHVMDEASRCDNLVLIRGGQIIANDTPSAIKEAAGTDDMDQAFLNLILAREGA